MFAPYSKSETRYPSNPSSPCEPQALSSASSNTPIAAAETELTSETGTCSETMQHAMSPDRMREMEWRS